MAYVAHTAVSPEKAADAPAAVSPTDVDRSKKAGRISG